MRGKPVKAHQTDNGDMAAKLTLRRYLLRKYHGSDPIRVLDCCQGSRRMWNALGREFNVQSYWGIDKKPMPGRMRLDSARILQLEGWEEDVVDIDTYGTPWKHWAGLIRTADHSVTVFLTWGQLNMTAPDNVVTAAAGIGELKIPHCLRKHVANVGANALLSQCGVYGKRIVEAVEAPSHGSARYLGIRLQQQPPASDTLSGELSHG